MTSSSPRSAARRAKGLEVGSGYDLAAAPGLKTLLLVAGLVTRLLTHVDHPQILADAETRRSCPFLPRMMRLAPETQ